MRGMTHNDRIETATVRHAEGNEGKKIGVKRGFGAFYGAKLLKRQGDRFQLSALTSQLLAKMVRKTSGSSNPSTTMSTDASQIKAPRSSPAWAGTLATDY
jgi:hypothetical protein